MGILKHEATGRRATLAARTLLGRASGCAVRLGSRPASGEHAVLAWDGSRWALRDLGSRNGTHVDGRRLTPGEWTPIAAGAVLVFGDASERWVLEEDGPPAASARKEGTDEVRCAAHGLLVLPDEADPHVTLFEDRDGLWKVEMDGFVRAAADHERVDAGGLWTLRVPPLAQGSAVTATASVAPDTPILRFEVSRDEEHIAISLVSTEGVVPLGGHAHNELLLALARARVRDRDADVADAEQGWVYVDDLLESLKVDVPHFNVNVFRARQRLARAGVLDVGTVIERRSMARQIRLGTAAVQIIRH